MIKITPANVVKTAAQDWKAQYCYDGKWQCGNYKRDAYKLLKKAQTVEEVNQITGSRFYTTFHCDECNEFSSVAVRFTTGEGHKLTLCLDCLNKAVKL